MILNNAQSNTRKKFKKKKYKIDFPITKYRLKMSIWCLLLQMSYFFFFVIILIVYILLPKKKTTILKKVSPFGA